MATAEWSMIAAHRERLLRIARRRCATREDAEDVVSEAMLRGATFEGVDERRLEQFLTAVTVRLCADLYRSADRGARAMVRLAPGADDVAPSPEDEVCGAVEAVVLDELVAALPARQRDVLFDRAHGLSLPQIARRHALSYKATESALARARGTMRAALAAAFAAVAAVVAAVRPRRVVVAALPVATLVAVGAVVRLPAGDTGVAVPALRAPAVTEAVRRAAPVQAERPAPVPVPARRAVRPPAPRVAAPPPATRESRRRVTHVGGDGPVRARVSQPDDGPLPGPAYFKKCVREGITVDVELLRGNTLLGVSQRCG